MIDAREITLRRLRLNNLGKDGGGGNPNHDERGRFTVSARSPMGEPHQWTRGLFTITHEKGRKSGRYGLGGGERYVLRHPDKGDYVALTLENAMERADK
jgi:hypothetical protein